MVDSVPRSIIYFSTDVESVLMSETEKSCWALAKQGGREFAAAPVFRMLNAGLPDGRGHGRITQNRQYKN
jgi:hypothetical protein